MQAMASREQMYVLKGTIQIDDAYLGGLHSGGKADQGSKNKNPLVAAISLGKKGHPLHAKLSPVAGLSLNAIELWVKSNLAPGSCVHSDGLARFNEATAAGCTHERTVVAGRKPKELPQFKWVNTIFGNLKTSLSRSHHAFDFSQYAARYLGAFAYRFNRRVDLSTLHARLLIAATLCAPQPLRLIRMAEHHC
jgi:hypothetical protein